MKRSVLLGSLFVAATVLAGCQSEAPGQSSTQQANPGKIVYDQQCAVCHGRTGKGDTMIATNYKWSDLTDAKWGYGDTREEITGSVVDGIPKTPMRGFKGALSEEEISNAVDYVMTLEAGELAN